MMFPLFARIAGVLRHDAAGNAAIELAIALPVFVMLVLITADYAFLANDTLHLKAATRFAAQFARKYPDASASTLAAHSGFRSGTTPSVTLLCTCPDNTSVTCPAPGDESPCRGSDTRVITYVRVNATQSFTPLFSHAGFAFPSSLSASMTLRAQ